MILSVWHTSWTVSDLDRSIAFYRDLLGFELVGTYRRVGFKFDAWHDVAWTQLML